MTNASFLGSSSLGHAPFAASSLFPNRNRVDMALVPMGTVGTVTRLVAVTTGIVDNQIRHQGRPTRSDVISYLAAGTSNRLIVTLRFFALLHMMRFGRFLVDSVESSPFSIPA